MGGYTCCKSLDREKRCPLAPEEAEGGIKAKAKGEPRTRGKRRRRGGGATAQDGTAEDLISRENQPAPVEAATAASSGAPQMEASASATSDVPVLASKGHIGDVGDKLNL